MSDRRFTCFNEEVLEAQARVCTGPHQTRPLGVKPSDPQPGPILELILKSSKGELSPDQEVSDAQMGAFFTGMTIRKRFPEKTRWSDAEREAFDRYSADLERMPPEVRFLIEPDQVCKATNAQEQIVIASLEKILSGEHLSYDETRRTGEAILNGQVRDALKAAALIGQRMNRETYDELRGYLDATLGPEQVLEVDVGSLTHLGEPFDGSTRFFRPTLFVAAVRAALGEASVLYGVDEMPPKNGVTDEQILNALGGRTDNSLHEAKDLIEDPEVGFAYVSQRIYSPGAYAIRDLRVHIKKRPPWSATEKAQRLFSSPRANHMIIGYFHPGYEAPLLQLMWDRGFQAGLAIKGEEGTSHYALRAGKPSDDGRKAVNYSQGFKRLGEERHDFSCDVDPAEYGFEYDHSPRLDSVSAEAFAKAGLAALSGEKGQVYDRIVLNAAVKDHLLGLCSDPREAIERCREAMDSGSALRCLKAYLERTKRTAQIQKV